MATIAGSRTQADQEDISVRILLEPSGRIAHSPNWPSCSAVWSYGGACAMERDSSEVKQMPKRERPVNPDAAQYRLLALFLKVANSARRSTSLVIAFVIGIWVNAASDPTVQSFPQLLLRIYDPSARAIAWIAIIATGLLVLLPLLRLALQRSLRRADFAIALSEVLDDKVDVRLRPLRRGELHGVPAPSFYLVAQNRGGLGSKSG